MISVGTATVAQASIDSKKNAEATEGGDGRTLETVNAEATSEPLLEIASDNHDPISLVQVTSYKHVETQVTSDHAVRVKVLCLCLYF